MEDFFGYLVAFLIVGGLGYMLYKRIEEDKLEKKVRKAKREERLGEIKKRREARRSKK